MNKPKTYKVTFFYTVEVSEDVLEDYRDSHEEGLSDKDLAYEIAFSEVEDIDATDLECEVRCFDDAGVEIA